MASEMHDDLAQAPAVGCDIFCDEQHFIKTVRLSLPRPSTHFWPYTNPQTIFRVQSSTYQMSHPICLEALRRPLCPRFSGRIISWKPRIWREYMVYSTQATAPVLPHHYRSSRLVLITHPTAARSADMTHATMMASQQNPVDFTNMVGAFSAVNPVVAVY